MGEQVWHISGEVIAIDRDTGMAILALEGFEEVSTVPIDPDWPEWMLDPRACFTTTIRRGDARTRTLSPHPFLSPLEQHPYGDMTEREILDALADMGRGAECQRVGHDFETSALDDDNVEWLCRRCGYRAVETHSEGGL